MNKKQYTTRNKITFICLILVYNGYPPSLFKFRQQIKQTQLLAADFGKKNAGSHPWIYPPKFLTVLLIG
jgi:hypothetical protein